MINAAVDDTSKSADQMQRGNWNAVTVTDGGRCFFSPASGYQRISFFCNFNSLNWLKEAEVFQKILLFFFADFKGNLRRTDVRRINQNLLQGQPAVFAAVILDCVITQFQRLGRVKPVGKLDLAAFQPERCVENFQNRTWFINCLLYTSDAADE